MTEPTRRRGGVYRREAEDKPARLVKGSRTAPPEDPAHRPKAEPASAPAAAPASKED